MKNILVFHGKYYIDVGLRLKYKCWGALKKINWKTKYFNFTGKNIFHEKYFKTFLKAKKHSLSFAIFYFFFRQQVAYFFQKLFSFCSFFSFLSNLILFSGGQVRIQKYFFNKLTIVLVFF